MHRNFATVRHRVTQFSAERSERNCLHDKGSWKVGVWIWQLNILCYAAGKWNFENQIDSRIFRANSRYEQTLCQVPAGRLLHRPVDLDLNVGPSAIPCGIPVVTGYLMRICEISW